MIHINKYILAIRYSLILVIIMGLILWTGYILNLGDLTWALISAVICTELEIDKAYYAVIWRIAATLIGIIIAVVMLLIFGSHFLTLITASIVITMICYCTFPVGNSWKLATATGVLVLVASLQVHSVYLAESVAIKRGIEVIFGSVTAGVVSLISNKLWEIIIAKMIIRKK